MTDPISLRQEGPAAHIQLQRPDSLNAVSIEMARALERAIVDAGREASVAVVVLRGAGGNFSVGGDHRELAALRDEGRGAMAELFGAFRAACDAVATCPAPVVAAVEGYALAGGFELLQVCDVVIARSDAKLGDHHVNFDMVPGGGGSQRLSRLVGRHRATAHLLLGDRLSPAVAAQWGLVHQVADPTSFESELATLVERLGCVDRSTASQIKRLVREGAELPLEEGLDLETAAVLEHLERPDALRRFNDHKAGAR